MSKYISIPSDTEGFILLQCHLCGEYFKLLASDINDDNIINIWCPYCGLNGRQYAPKEAIDAAIQIAHNEINEMIYNTFKKIERKTKGGSIQFKCNKKPVLNEVAPIKVRTDKLELQNYKCCEAVAKIQPLSKMCGSYCPTCGGINYE